jgi:ribosome-associated protein
MLRITPAIILNDDDLVYDYIRSSGPGGQNINKVATGVQLRFDMLNTAALSQEVKGRLKKLSGSRLSNSGVLIIEAKRFRSQEQNRLDAETRLVALIHKALEQPRERRPTRPSTSSMIKRIEAKKRHGQVKRLRQTNLD